MKVSEPTIAGAVEILKEEVDDLDKIIALPVFLAPGIHTNIDIPQLLGLEPLEVDPRCPDGNYPDEHYLSIADDVDFDGEIELLSSIGPRDELLDIIDKRINEALADSELGEDAKTGILLVTHGSRLNYNKEFATELYAKFEKACDVPSSFGFMELCGPSIPESINKLVDENDNAVGILFEKLDKSDLFKYVSEKGAFPRKTFSMGEGVEKRYYLEGRRITK